MKKLFIFWLTFGNLDEMGQKLVFSHQKRRRGQRHDGSACDGVAVSCDERRKTS